MNTKVILGLAVCCLLSALVGSYISSSVQAQAPSPVISGWPFSVNFVEDPFRMHGLQIESLYKDVMGATEPTISVVPSDKKFILTDITLIQDLAGSSPNYFDIKTQNTTKMRLWAWGMVSPISLNSGIVFEPGDEIRVKNWADFHIFLNLSGYFVDL